VRGCIALDFFGKALKPEHMHDGFCFLDSEDVQHGPTFTTLTEAVEWMHEQSDDLLVRLCLIPEKALEHV
jgi:hypothetical protein